MAIKKKTDVIEIRPIMTERVVIRIEGETPLIMHAWSEKAKRMMLGNQTGETKGKKKEPKKPVADFIESMYWLTDMPTDKTEEGFEKAIAAGARFGFPAVAFKSAAVSAAYRNGFTKDKVSIQGAIFILGNDEGMVEIHSDPPIMREDMVRIGMGTADIRYRGEFRNWYADLTLMYNKNGPYSLENLVNMINAGGFSCGIGEMRPEKGGMNGMYHVAAMQ